MGGPLAQQADFGGFLNGLCGNKVPAPAGEASAGDTARPERGSLRSGSGGCLPPCLTCLEKQFQVLSATNDGTVDEHLRAAAATAHGTQRGRTDTLAELHLLEADAVVAK